jgi:tRNA threonylcarbamoyladenosine biosynthesis protein TsaE
MAENGTVMVTGADEEMRRIARRVADALEGGENLLLYGDLGAGKTTFVQGLAEGFNVTQTVKSPTFTFLKEYALPRRSTRLAHYDLYRLADSPSDHDLESIELPERLTDPDVITVIEWADRLPELPPRHHRINFTVESDGSHTVALPDPLYQRVAG